MLAVVRPIIKKKKILYLQVAGGIICGENIQESMIRECAEEASISEELARTATPAGCVRYCTETIPSPIIPFLLPKVLVGVGVAGEGGGRGRTSLDELSHCCLYYFSCKAKHLKTCGKIYFLFSLGILVNGILERCFSQHSGHHHQSCFLTKLSQSPDFL